MRAPAIHAAVDKILLRPVLLIALLRVGHLYIFRGQKLRAGRLTGAIVALMRGPLRPSPQRTIGVGRSEEFRAGLIVDVMGGKAQAGQLAVIQAVCFGRRFNVHFDLNGDGFIRGSGGDGNGRIACVECWKEKACLIIGEFFII
jgi:hypothetical protein